MSEFTTPLKVEFIDGRKWVLCSAFTYCVGSLEEPHDEITVPAGFETDFASIPRIFWGLLPPTGKYGKAAVLHDFMYSRQQSPRKYADDVFYEAMGVLNVPDYVRKTMYLAVRLFGWIVWKNKG